MTDKKQLTYQDINKFKLALEKTGNSQQLDFFTFMLNTGLRTLDVLELKFTDVDYKSNSITINQINKNPSSIALNEESMQVLRRLHAKYPNDIFVFQSRKSQNQKNKPASSISRQVVTKAFKTASDKSSLPITPNAIRHYYATQLFLKSAIEKSDPELLSQLFGHQSMNMTMDYVKLSKSEHELSPQFMENTLCNTTKHHVNNCHMKNNESLKCLFAPKADMTNREPEIIEYLLNGGSLSEDIDLDDICKKYGISESDLTITLKTIKVLAKPVRSEKDLGGNNENI